MNREGNDINHMPGIIGRGKKKNKNEESLPIIKQIYIYIYTECQYM